MVHINRGSLFPSLSIYGPPLYWLNFSLDGAPRQARLGRVSSRRPGYIPAFAGQALFLMVRLFYSIFKRARLFSVQDSPAIALLIPAHSHLFHLAWLGTRGRPYLFYSSFIPVLSHTAYWIRDSKGSIPFCSSLFSISLPFNRDLFGFILIGLTYWLELSCNYPFWRDLDCIWRGLLILLIPALFVLA